MMASKIKPFIVTFNAEKDVDETQHHMNAISKTSTPVDMTQMHDSTWSLLAPGLRLMTIGKNIFIRLYNGTMRVLSLQVDDVEDAQGRSIKELLK